MKILLINHYAGSDRFGMEYRPFYLAREWVSCGHDVTIIAADQSHLRGSQPEVGEDLARTEEEGVRYCWLKTPRYAGNGAGRVFNILTFVMKLTHYVKRIVREIRPDIVICSSTYPLDIYPGGLIARESNARLVYEVHDLWPMTPMLLGGYKRWHPYIKLLQRAEDRAYCKADAVVSILPDTRRYMLERGMESSKFIHIPNGIPAARLKQHPQPNLSPHITPVIKAERARGRFLVGYAGSLTLSMDVNLLLDVAFQEQARDVSFLIAGDGPTAFELHARLRSTGMDNVHMLGRLPKAEVQGFLANMDALAVPWHGNRLYSYGISPNKIFDYMFSGRPILQASDASNDLVSEARCGFTVPPGSPGPFASAIHELRALPPATRDRLGANGHRFVCKYHDVHDLAARFLVAIDDVTLNGQRASIHRSERHAMEY